MLTFNPLESIGLNLEGVENLGDPVRICIKTGTLVGLFMLVHSSLSSP